MNKEEIEKVASYRADELFGTYPCQQKLHYKIGFIDGAETLKQELDRLKNPWVKCSERLPEISQTYIVDYTINGEQMEPSIAYYSYITKEWDFLSPYQGFENFVAINWCELPEPPQQ